MRHIMGVTSNSSDYLGHTFRASAKQTIYYLNPLTYYVTYITAFTLQGFPIRNIKNGNIEATSIMCLLHLIFYYFRKNN